MSEIKTLNGYSLADKTVREKLLTDYELIETVTVEEEGITSISRNAEPDGTAYKLKKILAVLSFPVLEEEYVTGIMEHTVHVSIESGSKRVYSGYSPSQTLAATYYDRLFRATLISEIDGGVINSRSNESIDISLESSKRGCGPVAMYVGDTWIRHLYVYVANGIPVGSTYEIYGVRI